MNYLAHALLSPHDPLVLMGNLWGDLLKPRDYVFLEEGIRRGIERHKQIDSFTDHHNGVEEIVKLLRPYQGKYTPVVADVLMDYTLSKYWPNFQDQTLEDFCQAKYRIVSSHLHFIPDRLHPRISRMLSHRWLESCANRDRMEKTLFMLSKRAAFENNIPNAMIAYDTHQETIDQLFLNFFEDAQSHINLRNAS